MIWACESSFIQFSADTPWYIDIQTGVSPGASTAGQYHETAGSIIPPRELCLCTSLLGWETAAYGYKATESKCHWDKLVFQCVGTAP